MKMQDAVIEIILFDVADVIATSTDEDATKVIWLTPQSIENYNKIAATQDKPPYSLKLQVPEPYDPFTFAPLPLSNYYSYSGFLNGGWQISSSQESTPSKGLYEVSSPTDTDGYDKVFKWLFDNRKT